MSIGHLRETGRDILKALCGMTIGVVPSLTDPQEHGIAVSKDFL